VTSAGGTSQAALLPQACYPKHRSPIGSNPFEEGTIRRCTQNFAGFDYFQIFDRKNGHFPAFFRS
jgi:hypothetical protein